jgi:O-antigen/teichoic acid export membrane protein
LWGVGENPVLMKKKYIITFITEFIVLISSILVYKLAAFVLGNTGFSEYALSRRILSFIQPVILMGLTVGIPRYMGYHSTASSEKRDFYFISGAVITFLAVLIFIPILFLFKKEMSFLLFASSDYSHFIFPINLLLIGTIGHLLCYSYFRGRLSMLKANILQTINIAILPLAVFGFAKDTVNILVLLGGGRCIITLVFLYIIFRQLIVLGLRKHIVSYSKELLRYSIPRVPGDFGWAALLSLVAFFTAHSAGVTEAGTVAFGISLLVAAGSLLSPIGIVLLPHASRMVAKLEMSELRVFVRKLLLISTSLTFFGVIIFEMFGGRIIELYLGHRFGDMTLTLKILILASIPYGIFVTMVNIIDSFYIKAMNTKNILISLCFFLLCGGLTTMIGGGYLYIIIEFVSAFTILGLLTLIDVKRIFASRSV